MRYILLLLPLIVNTAFAQKEKTVTVSCYVNPELYIQANVIAQVSDKAGNVSCKGRYISLNNKSKTLFYYKSNNRWLSLKPQGKAIILVGTTTKSSDGTPSILKLTVKYKPDVSGGIATKIGTISEINAQTDKIKAREFETGKSQKPASKPVEAIAKVEKPVAVQKAEPVPVKPTAVNPTVEKVAASQPEAPVAKATPSKSKPAAKKVAVKSRPRTSSAPSSRTSGTKYSYASDNSIGLRMDFGTGATGIGPNYKHKFNRKVALDAALVFYKGGVVGLGAQVEQNIPVRSDPGLNFYIGIGPQFLFEKENTALAIVPVTGLQYNIPRSPINFSFDWRPNFYVSPEADVQAGRFGLSLRVEL